MEKEINIAEILKDKPKGTKLYSSACGKCELKEADDKSFKISFYSSKSGFMNGGEGTFDKNGNLYDDGECIVFPSKEMRDWSKFAWKKGDVLVDGNGLCQVVFEEFEDVTYTTFKGMYWLKCDEDDSLEYKPKIENLNTAGFHLDSSENIRCYIQTISELTGRKLNLETLEIEKPQPEFKDGDILTCDIHPYGKSFVIFKYYSVAGGLYYHAALSDYSKSLYLTAGIPWCHKDYNIRYATEEEKQRLFEALAKEGKRWNAEKKVIEDIKKEYQFEPFERVLVRDTCDDMWKAAFFSHIKDDDNSIYKYVCNCLSWRQCIPYEGNESLLGTDKDVEE